MEEQHYQLLDGKAVSAQMKKEMAEEVAQIKAAGGKIPHLAAILVGHDGGRLRLMWLVKSRLVRRLVLSLP